MGKGEGKGKSGTATPRAGKAKGGGKGKAPKAKGKASKTSAKTRKRAAKDDEEDVDEEDDPMQEDGADAADDAGGDAKASPPAFLSRESKLSYGVSAGKVGFSKLGLRAYLSNTIDMLTATIFDDRRHTLNTLCLHEFVAHGGFNRLCDATKVMIFWFSATARW